MRATTITTEGRLLAADSGDRTLRYLLLPYGEQGRTSMGRMVASRGTVQVPEDLRSVHLDIEHDRTRPVGWATSVEDTDTGMLASFEVARTRAGDDLLEEAAAGLRTGVSVDTEGTVVRGGRLVAARLVSVGAVVQPAFPSAQLVASDHGDDEEDTPTTEEAAVPTTPAPEATPTITTTTTPAAPAPVQPAPAGTPDGGTGPIETTPVQAPQPGPGATEQPAPAEQPASDDDTDGTEPEDDNEEEATVPETTMTASAPVGSLASRRPAARAAMGRGDLYRMLATAHQEGGSSRLTAALSDIVPANILGLEQPQFVGELWSGRAYSRRIVPLFNHGDLTSYRVAGWRWVTKPVVAPYAGNKTAVPSNAVETAAVTQDAARLAGAHDIDRKFRDFNDTEFFRAYFEAMTESYAVQSDLAVFNAIETAAGSAITVGTVPTGVSRGVAMIADGALDVLNSTRRMPTFALVHPSLWRDILLTRSEDSLAFLNASLGLDEGTLTAQNFPVVPWPDLNTGQVLVGARDAATVYELGTVPIRVEAVDLTKGGVDEGVFGYYAVLINNAAGLSLVDDGVA